MNEYEKLKRNFKRNVKKLQQEYPYENWTKWMRSFNAWNVVLPYAHRYCKRCNKTEKKRVE